MSDKIPEGWKKCKMGDVITLHYGKGLREIDRSPGNIPVFGSNGIVGQHNEFLVKGPGIIVGRKGSVGEIKYSKKDFFPIDTTYYVGTTNENDMKFLYYFLLTLHLNEMNSHSAVPGLNRNDVYSLDILLPPLPEQRAIAEVLSSLDDKIDLLHRQNKTLEGMAEALFRQWFVEGAEEGWFKGCISDYCDVIDCLHSKKPEEIDVSEFYLLQVYNIGDGGEIDLTNKYYVSESDYKEWIRRIELKGGEIIISKTGRVAAMAQIPEFITTGIGRNLVAVRAKQPFTSEYLKDLMFSSWMKRMIQLNTSDGTILESIHVKSIASLPVINPGQYLINEYSKTVSPVHEKINKNLRQIITLEKLRDTLLPKLMSGEVRVEYEKEAEKPEPAEDFISQHIEESIRPWPITKPFMEAVLFSGVVAAMSDDRFNPDRVRVTKAEYLAKRFMGMDVLGEYSKMAAGPYDPAIRYKGPEKIAKNNGYVEQVGDTKFKKGSKFQGVEKYLEKYGYRPALEWLEHFKYMKNKELELLATVDYAALDLLRHGKNVSVESVINYIKADEKWKKKLKEKADVFNPEKVKWALRKLAEMFPGTYSTSLEGVE